MSLELTPYTLQGYTHVEGLAFERVTADVVDGPPDNVVLERTTQDESGRVVIVVVLDDRDPELVYEV